MTSLTRVAAITLVAVFSLVCFATADARAEPLQGDVYAVFADGGSFDPGLGEQTYTVLHIATYAWDGYDFGSMAPTAYPLQGQPAEAFGAVPGGQFFLLGSLNGDGESEDHLLISAEGVPPGQTPPNFVDPAGTSLHDDLIAGTNQLRLEGPVTHGLAANDFWNENYAGGTAGRFFGLPGTGLNPILSLGTSSIEDGGSEDLFGYGPFASRLSRDDIDFLALFGRLKECAKEERSKIRSLIFGSLVSDDWSWLRQQWVPNSFCACINPGTPREGEFVGSLGGPSLQSLTFTNLDGRTFDTPVPEPTTLVLVSGALVVGFGIRRKRRAA